MNQVVSASLPFDPPVSRPQPSGNSAGGSRPVCRRGQELLGDPGIVPSEKMVQKITESPFVQQLGSWALVASERGKAQGAGISQGSSGGQGFRGGICGRRGRGLLGGGSGIVAPDGLSAEVEGASGKAGNNDPRHGQGQEEFTGMLMHAGSFGWVSRCPGALWIHHTPTPLSKGKTPGLP